MTSRFLIAVAPLAMLAACSTGPAHVAPNCAATKAAQGRWVEPAPLGPVDTQWWTAFGDPVLDTLVAKAMEGTPDLREAEARVAEARANRDAVAGGRLPSVQATGSATQNLLSANGQLPAGKIPGLSRDIALFDMGFDASWEIDLWGRRAQQIEGAGARMGMAEWARRDVQLALIAEVARSYAELRGAEAAEGSIARIAAAQADLLRLVALRFKGGEATRMDVDRATSDARLAAANIGDAASRAAAAKYRLAALLGLAPEGVTPLLGGREGVIPMVAGKILVGARSELLERRPDIRRAEYDLWAAGADVAVARTDLMPRFSLLGSLGQQARTPGDLFSTDSTRLSIGPRFSWPIFSRGTIKAQIRANEARVQGAAARYDKAVYGALADSETAINRYIGAGYALSDVEGARRADDDAYRMIQLRVSKGEDDRLTLARAAIAHEVSVQRSDGAKLGQTQAAIALYKALGGGWRDQ